MGDPAHQLDPTTLPELLYGITVRSTIATGRIRAIHDAGPAGGARVWRVDARDLPDRATTARVFGDRPLLATERVRHEAEPILLLAGETPAAVAAAAAAVTIDYEPGEPVTSIEKALAAYQTVYGIDNVYQRYEFRRGNVMRALATADVVREDKVRVAAVEPMDQEPRSVFAVPRNGGGMTVFGAWTAPEAVHRVLCELFGWRDDAVHVCALDGSYAAALGGSLDAGCTAPVDGELGSIPEHWPMLAVHAALLARKCGRAVRLDYHSRGDMRAMARRHPAIIRHLSGFRSDGTLVARDILVFLDGGAYNTSSADALVRTLLVATGPYRCENVRVRGRVMATNTPPFGALLADGGPQAAYGCELHLERAARDLGVDALELRRLNALRPGDRLASGQVIGRGAGAVETFAAALDEAPRWRRAADRAASGGGGVRSGIGLGACMVIGGLRGGLAAQAESLFTGRQPLDVRCAAHLVEVQVERDSGCVRVARVRTVAVAGTGEGADLRAALIREGTRQALGFGFQPDTDLMHPGRRSACPPLDTEALDVAVELLEPGPGTGASSGALRELAMGSAGVALVSAVGRALECDFDIVPITPASILATATGTCRPWRAVTPSGRVRRG